MTINLAWIGTTVVTQQSIATGLRVSLDPPDCPYHFISATAPQLLRPAMQKSHLLDH
ncbi:MAG: hypothetical protein PHQ04_12135 [Opitutaceae bacterium]|nr:hypothetical protein [Opitutaceae bacterium]